MEKWNKMQVAGWICAAALAFAGCADTADKGEPAPEYTVYESFEAQLPVLETGSGALAWHSGDRIGLWLNAQNANLPFTLQDGGVEADGRTAAFGGYIADGTEPEVAALACYPYWPEGKMTATGAEGTFAAAQYEGVPVTVPLIGRYAGSLTWMRFEMAAPFAVFVHTLSKDPEQKDPVRLRQIVFRGNRGETVAGGMTLSADESGAHVSFAGTGDKTLTLDCGAGVELTDDPRTFWMVVPALNFPEGYTFEYRTDLADADAVVVQADAEEGEIRAGETYRMRSVLRDFQYSIPDTVFRKWLVERKYVEVTDAAAGLVKITEAGAQAEEFICRSMGISSLEGIGYFPALKYLDCAHNRLTTLNVVRNTALTELDCSANQLTRLEVGSQAALEHISCAYNRIEALDVAGCPALRSLYCNGNRLETLDIRSNPALETLYCYSNSLETLDAAGMAAPGSYLLYCGGQQTGVLRLTLSAEQRPRWEGVLAGAEANGGVELVP